MSAPETQTAASDEQQHPPEIRIFARFAAIPMISSSLESINDILANNAYTRQPYAHAKEFSNTAYKLTEPIQVRLAPLIIRVDGFANMAVDAVESRYPYPFTVQPQEVATYVRERKDSTISGVNKAIDAKVRTPAFNVAQGIDQRFAPLVDYIEFAVIRLNQSETPSTPPDAKYQYQRALALSKTLRGNLYVYTNDQLKHLQAQSVIAQKASETAHAITGAASSSLSSAQARVHTLSDNMLAELQKLQTSTSQFRASLQSSVHDSASHIQAQIAQIHQSYGDLSAALSSTVHQLTGIITQKDLPVQEKMSQVSKEVQSRVTPLLEAVKKAVSEVLARSKEAASPNGHPSETKEQ